MESTNHRKGFSTQSNLSRFQLSFVAISFTLPGVLSPIKDPQIKGKERARKRVCFQHQFSFFLTKPLKKSKLHLQGKMCNSQINRKKGKNWSLSLYPLSVSIFCLSLCILSLLSLSILTSLSTLIFLLSITTYILLSLPPSLSLNKGNKINYLLPSG